MSLPSVYVDHPTVSTESWNTSLHCCSHAISLFPMMQRVERAFRRYRKDKYTPVYIYISKIYRYIYICVCVFLNICCYCIKEISFFGLVPFISVRRAQREGTLSPSVTPTIDINAWILFAVGASKHQSNKTYNKKIKNKNKRHLCSSAAVRIMAPVM